MIVGVLDMYQLHSIGWYRRFGAQASTKNSILTVTPLIEDPFDETPLTTPLKLL